MRAGLSFKSLLLIFLLMSFFACNSSSGGSSQDGRDTESPSKPSSVVQGEVTSRSVALSWPASTDNVGVSRYRIYKNGAMISETTGTSYTDASITDPGRYCYSVSAIDEAGNESEKSQDTCVDVIINDSEAPSVPEGLTASTEAVVVISWTASTDNHGVAGYKIFRDGNYLSSVNSPSFKDTGITATERHYYNVSAYDAAGNESSISAPVFINRNPGKVLWKFETGGEINTDPAIADDGTVYASSSDGYLYAINPDGTLKWKYNTEGTIRDYNSPSIGADGTIYIGSSAFLHALNPDGSVKWKYEVSTTTCAAVTSGGTVYVGGGGSFQEPKIYAINTDGSLKWKISGQTIALSIGSDGTIYADRAYNQDGTVKWEFPVDSRFSFSVLGNDGSIFSNGPDYLYAYDANGNEKWKLDSNPNERLRQARFVVVTYGVFSGAAIGPDGTVYAASAYSPGHDYLLNAVNPDGTVKWKYVFQNTRFTSNSPAVGADGSIYLIADDNNLYAFSKDGAVKWKTLTGESKSSPAIGKDGIIYIGSSDNNIYAIDSESMGLADSRCPKIHRDNRNSGNYMPIIHQDSNAPAVPSNIQIKPSTKYPSSLDLTWDASVDDTGVATGYKIYRNGIFIGLKGLGFTDKDVSDSTSSNCYRISAVDEAGNESELSPEICSDVPAPSEGVEVKWKYKTDGREIKKTIMGNDGTIYITVSDTYKTYAIDKNGLLKWDKLIYGYFGSISDDNTMYVPLGRLIAYDAEGNSKWSNIPQVLNAQPAIGKDGTVYASDEQFFFALSPDGNLKWKTETSSKIGTSLAIASDGTIYRVSGSGNLLHAISPEGSVKWNYDNALSFAGSPAIGGDGTVYIAGENSDLLAIKPDGVLKYKIPGLLGTRLLVGLDGIIYAGSADGRTLQAINSDGTFKWALSFQGNEHATAPVQGADGIIYIAPGDGYLYAIKPDGIQKWKLSIGAYSPAPGSPSIDSDGTLYLGVTYPNTVGAYIYAIQTSSMGLANSSWPSVYRDNQNTCRVP